MAEKKAAPTEVPPVVITITLPTEDGAPAIMVIQRGMLGQVRSFPYETTNLAEMIQDAYISLQSVEASPPVIPAPPPTPTAPARPASTYVPPKREPVELMLDIPLTKGKQSIKASHLQLVGEHSDEAAMNAAKLIVGKLIDGKLWDGKSPISLDDVYGVQRKLKHLLPKDLVLFTLDEFVKVGVAPAAPQPEPVIEAEDIEEEEAGELAEVEE